MKPWTCPRCSISFPNPRGIGGHIRACQVTHEELFWAKVDKAAGSQACWPWTGAFYWKGYGRWTSNRTAYSAHKRAWVLTNGPVPDGMQVLHNCDNPACCNPTHLRLGTHDDNMADKRLRSRMACKVTHDDVRAIRKLLGTKTGKAIAAQFNVSESVVSQIKTGKHWGYVK